MADIQKPKGTSDILPEQSRFWIEVENRIRSTASLRGFREIRFPMFEATELFCRGVGDGTDIVQKEMYTFTDKDGRSLSLRPEGTACVVRSIVENGLYMRPMPLRLCYMGSFFRYEKPQAGRSREFCQFGAELFGSASPLADAELILLAADVFRALGVKSVKLKINSIGCAECRKKFRGELLAYFETKKDALCETCRGRLETNPLRILDCKCPECRAAAAGAPKTTDCLCSGCREHYEGVKSALASAGEDFEEDSCIVRGLDYYTGVVFEFVSSALGAQSTVCGGGRYDTLVRQLGGPELCGVGFGMGITRLLAVMEADGVLPDAGGEPDVYIAPINEAMGERAYMLARELRQLGIAAESDLCRRSLKAQMKYADKAGARYTLVLGDSELESGFAVLKDMRGSGTETVSLQPAEIAEAVLGKQAK